MPLHIERHPQGLMLDLAETRITADTTHALAPDSSIDCACRIILDLREVRFLEPFGLIYLYWLVHGLLHRGAELVTILSPTSEDVRTYLVRMHFPQVLVELGQVRFHPDIATLRVRERPLTNRLVEFTCFTLEDDDQVRQLTSSIMETILTQGVELRIEAGYLRLGLVELLSNIEVHSQTRAGALVVQRYAGGRVQIAIGDGGIGIPGALQSVVGPLSDEEIVLRSLEPEVTSRKGRGGLGLPMIVDAIHATDGHMVIRSGRAHARVASRQAVTIRGDCAPIPGTQIEINWV